MDRSSSLKPTILLAILSLSACSEAPKTTPVAEKPAETKSEPEKPAEPVTAKAAFFEMYTLARSWAPDLLPLSLVSNDVPGFKIEDGKAAMWTAIFVSPGRHEARTFSYAVVTKGTAHKGVTVGAIQPWSGATPKSKPFQITEFVVDSDKAYGTAYPKAASWAKKHPDKGVAFFLGNASRFPGPVWYLLWGNNKSGYAAYVNATTGIVGTR
jgi:hypothetical protein